MNGVAGTKSFGNEVVDPLAGKAPCRIAEECLGKRVGCDDEPMVIDHNRCVGHEPHYGADEVVGRALGAALGTAPPAGALSLGLVVTVPPRVRVLPVTRSLALSGCAASATLLHGAGPPGPTRAFGRCYIGGSSFPQVDAVEQPFDHPPRPSGDLAVLVAKSRRSRAEAARQARKLVGLSW